MVLTQQLGCCGALLLIVCLLKCFELPGFEKRTKWWLPFPSLVLQREPITKTMNSAGVSSSCVYSACYLARFHLVLSFNGLQMELPHAAVYAYYDLHV